MADYTVKKVGEFPAAISFNAEDVLFVEQYGKAKKLSGELLQEFCRAAISALVERAETAAENAEAAQESIATLEATASTLESGEPATATVTEKNGKIVISFGLPKGNTGSAFTYEDFTEEQLEALRGPKGEAFTYADFTEEQMEALRGPAGSSIQSIERTSGTGAAGSVDTYTITLTDGTTATFSVYNGKDGEGAGDMTAAVYDPQNKQTDVFKYVDDAVSNIDVEITADEVTFADGETFQQKYNSGELTGPAGKDGEDGEDGENATINGVNTLTIQGGEGINVTQEGSTLTVSAKCSYGTEDLTAGTSPLATGAVHYVYE